MRNWMSLSHVGSIAVVLLLATVAERQWVPGAHAAEGVTVETISRALKQRKTRSVKPEQSTQLRREIEDLKRIRRTRGWNMHDRVRLANTTPHLPQIDLEIYFAFDSAEISKQAEPVLNKLGQALAQEEHKGRAFVLAGHTDAKGTSDYNQALSERRAEAVKRYIAERFKLARDDLFTVGYGFEQLKDPRKPLDGVNRRVQIVNFEPAN